MSVPLDTSSKRDRSPGLIESLMDHGEEQAAHFLETSRKLSALERAWEGKDVEAMMGLFSEDATIGFAMSPDSPAEEVRYRRKQQIRDSVKRSLKSNLSIEQAREYATLSARGTTTKSSIDTCPPDNDRAACSQPALTSFHPRFTRRRGFMVATSGP